MHPSNIASCIEFSIISLNVYLFKDKNPCIIKFKMYPKDGASPLSFAVKL